METPLVIVAPGSTFSERTAWIAEHKPELSARLLEYGALRFSGLGEDDPELLRFWIAHFAAHVPKPYDGRVTLFVSDEQLAHFGSTLVRRWRDVARNARFHSIRGHHQSCITRYGDETAALLALVLSRDAREP